MRDSGWRQDRQRCFRILPDVAAAGDPARRPPLTGHPSRSSSVDTLGLLAALYYLSAREAMPVRRPKAKFPKSPRLIRRFGHDQRTSSSHIPVELIDVIDVPIREVRVVP